MKIVVCLLSVNPDPRYYDFLKEIQDKTGYKAFISIDNNDYDISNLDGSIPIIRYENKLCENEGYKSTIRWMNGEASSRDKALYYFNREYHDYDHIWFFEEDVFVPTADCFKKIDDKSGNSDLMCKWNKTIGEFYDIWHWKYVVGQLKGRFDFPLARSLICAMRCSKSLMKCVDDYARKYNDLFMDEALFNTLVMKNNLTVENPEEFETIIYRHNWNEKTVKTKNHLYHPIKNYDYHISLRKFFNV